MAEKSIMEIVGIVLTGASILLIVIVGLFMININQTQDFKRYVNTQIERYGGLPEEAMANIEEYNQKYFEGEYTLTSDYVGQTVPYGTEVDYVVTRTIDMGTDRFSIPPLPFEGSTVSLCR